DVRRLPERALPRQQSEVVPLELDAHAARAQTRLAQPPRDLVRLAPKVECDLFARARVLVERDLRAKALRRTRRHDLAGILRPREGVKAPAVGAEKRRELVRVRGRDVADGREAERL